MDKQVVAALLKMVSVGKVTYSNISRQSISEVRISSGGHTINVTWYPRSPFGKIRTLTFDGVDTPLYDADATVIMRAIQELAEEEFSRRASDIIAAAV